MIKLLVVAAVTLGLCSAFASTPLDGKKFTGTITHTDDKTTENDTLIFKDGKFTSTGCTKYGFKATSYEAKTEGDTTTFTATTENDNKAKMSWTGTIKGDTVDAKATWTHEKEPSKEMTFTGTTVAKAKGKKKKK